MYFQDNITNFLYKNDLVFWGKNKFPLKVKQNKNMYLQIKKFILHNT